MDIKRKRIRIVLILVIVAGLLYAANKPLFKMINGLNSPSADWIFLTVTHLGNGLVAAMIALLLAAWNREITLRTALGMFIAGTLTSLVKEIASSPRPLPVLGDVIHIVGPGLRGNSLPSGHTATAFAFAFSLRNSVNRSVYYLCLLIAVGVGYSRIYIGAHFPLDVYLGMLAGWAGARLADYPSKLLLSKWSGDSKTVRMGIFLLAGIAGIWIAFFEPMVPYNPYVLRIVGLSGAMTAAYFIYRIVGTGGESP